MLGIFSIQSTSLGIVGDGKSVGTELVLLFPAEAFLREPGIILER